MSAQIGVMALNMAQYLRFTDSVEFSDRARFVYISNKDHCRGLRLAAVIKIHNWYDKPDADELLGAALAAVRP